MPSYTAGYEAWGGSPRGSFPIEARNLLDAYLRATRRINSGQEGLYGGRLSELIDDSGGSVRSENLEAHLYGMRKLVLLSGPSGVGKGPLREAVGRIVPTQTPVLYTSRAARKDEVEGSHYHFRTRSEVDSFRGDPRFIVGEVRDMVQAIDLGEIDFSTGRTVFVEAYHTLGSLLRQNSSLPGDTLPISIFISPLSKDEIARMKEVDPTGLKREVARRSLEGLKRRSLVKEGVPYERLPAEKQIDLQVRARDAIDELRQAYKYDFVLVNHDGEGHPNWDGRMAGDALRAVEALARILRFGIYRPEIIIQECPGDRLILHPTAPSPYAAAAIEFWDENTV